MCPEETEMLDKTAVRKLAAGGKEGLLSQADQYALIEAMQSGQPDLAKMAQDVLVLRNMGLCTKVAAGYVTPGSQDFNDAKAEAVIGLIDGLHRFDLSKGVSLATYVTTWIRYRVQEWVQAHQRNTVYASHDFRRFAARVRKAQAELEMQHQRPVSVNEIAGRLDESAAEVEEALAYSCGTVSLAGARAGGSEDTENTAVLEDAIAAPDESVDSVVGRAQAVKKLRLALMALPSREREVLLRRFGLSAIAGEERAEESLSSIAEGLKADGGQKQISNERARQLAARGLSLLKESLAAVGVTADMAKF